MALTNTKFPRSVGVLLHITSLPGEYGVGTFGNEAKGFIDFLADCGFHYWQVLPFGPVDSYHSPYKSLSAFAGEPMLIDPEGLCKMGLIHSDELDDFKSDNSIYTTDYDSAKKLRENCLRLAYSRITPTIMAEVHRFKQQHSWLKDYALWAAICAEEKNLMPSQWHHAELKHRKTKAMEAAEHRLQNEINYHSFVQYIFARQWDEIKNYAHSKNIAIIGDMPIYVDENSPDVWAHPEWFMLDRDGRPTLVAGVPPDLFAEDGQLWGNPLYNWENMAKDSYSWWSDRIKHQLNLFDAVRIDHFRAFSAYWAVPAEATTAKAGSWQPGPGLEFFKKITAQIDLSTPRIIAEDLGIINDAVRELIAATGFPGMRVLQFAFMEDGESTHLPHTYCHNTVAYTGTHDNNTLLGFLWELSEEKRQRTLSYIGMDPTEDSLMGGPYAPGCRALLRELWHSPADLVILPIQDLMGYGSDTRMNTPGVAEGNWGYRLTWEALKSIDRDYIRKLNQLYYR